MNEDSGLGAEDIGLENKKSRKFRMLKSVIKICFAAIRGLTRKSFIAGLNHCVFLLSEMS